MTSKQALLKNSFTVKRKTNPSSRATRKSKQHELSKKEAKKKNPHYKILETATYNNSGNLWP